MGDSQNTKNKIKQENKIISFIKENIIIIWFFIINLIVATWLFFIVWVQQGIIDNWNDTIDNEIGTINKAYWKVLKVEWNKISLFKDTRKIELYTKALNKFLKMFWKDNVTIKLNGSIMSINKSYLNNHPNMSKIKDYIYWALANNIKLNINSYPIKTNVLGIIIR